MINAIEIGADRAAEPIELWIILKMGEPASNHSPVLILNWLD